MYVFYVFFTFEDSTSCSGCLITLSVADLNKILKQVNVHKAAGPDGLPGHVHRACDDQLASVFGDIFKLSLTQSVIPTCFNQTTLVPVPKSDKITFLNDYRPVALTSVAMKDCSWLTSTPSSQTPWTHSKAHTAPTDPQMIKSLLHSTLPFPTWTKGTHT